MKSFLMMFLFFISACGGLDTIQTNSKDKIVVGDEAFLGIGTHDLVNQFRKVSGTGSLRSAKSLRGVDSAYHYELQFSLRDQGKLTLVSHAGENLESGIEIHFLRNGSELYVELESSRGKRNVSQNFLDLNPLRVIELGVDVHNDHGSSAHVMIWNEQTEQLVLDTSKMLRAAPARGLGRHWGLRVNLAEVLEAEAGEPEHEH